jgi:hypothetical protein
MIDMTMHDNRVEVSVMGQFTADDYHQFEEAVAYGVRFQGKVNVLLDLRDMLSYSVDVAWEELRFTREHKNDFGRIAVLTGDQWVAWSLWLNRLFMSAEIQLFDDLEQAQAWISVVDIPGVRA